MQVGGLIGVGKGRDQRENLLAAMRALKCGRFVRRTTTMFVTCAIVHTGAHQESYADTSCGRRAIVPSPSRW